MATPFVTGLAAYMKAYDPSLDWISIKNLIISSGKPIAAASKTTISGRRIRITDTHGQGAASCSDQIVTARLLPKGDSYTLKVGQSLKLSMLKINCAKSMQSTKNGLLNDLGINGDDLAYDGVFNGAYTPTSPGVYILAFPNGDNVNLTVTD